MARLPLEPMDWSALRERPAELAAYERKDGQFALGALREYVPAWVSATPQELVLPGGPAAVDATAPVSAELPSAPTSGRAYDLAAAAPSTVTLDLFYHPALAARLDGQPTPLRPSGDDGLATLDVPPGRHRLAVGPEETPVERLGLAVTVAAAAVCLVLAAASSRRAATAPALVLLVVGLAWAGAAAAAPTARLVPDRAPELAGAARILGADLDSRLVESAGVLTVDLHVQALRPVPDDAPMSLWLVGPGGRRLGEEVSGAGRGIRADAGASTSCWSAGPSCGSAQTRSRATTSSGCGSAATRRSWARRDCQPRDRSRPPS
jgi:hypothetical protein